MKKRRPMIIFISVLLAIAVLPWGVDPGWSQPTLTPGVNYRLPNFAYSPTTIKKFVDSLPGVNTANNLLQQLPLATPDKLTFPGSDYYEISLVEYRERMHTNLPAAGAATKLRGYVQTNNGTNAAGTLNNVAPAPVHYLGPVILATKNRPVRVKFTNALPATSAGGNLFLPVDTTIMGQGWVPRRSLGLTAIQPHKPAPITQKTAPPYISMEASLRGSAMEPLTSGLPPPRKWEIPPSLRV